MHLQFMELLLLLNSMQLNFMEQNNQMENVYVIVGLSGSLPISTNMAL